MISNKALQKAKELDKKREVERRKKQKQNNLDRIECSFAFENGICPKCAGKLEKGFDWWVCLIVLLSVHSLIKIFICKKCDVKYIMISDDGYNNCMIKRGNKIKAQRMKRGNLDIFNCFNE